MSWALIARPESDRGLGIQTQEIARNLKPDLVFVMHLEGEDRWNHDLSAFEDSFVHNMKVRSNWTTDVDKMIARMRRAGVTSLFTVESWYDQRLVEASAANGIRTVNQMNPEFYRPSRPQPAQWAWPTPWMAHRMPRGVLLPVPVPWVAEPRPRPGNRPLRVLHVAGKFAVGDRNGTRVFIDCLKHITEPVEVKIATQDRFDKIRDLLINVGSDATVCGNQTDRRTIFDDVDLLVMPRR